MLRLVARLPLPTALLIIAALGARTGSAAAQQPRTPMTDSTARRPVVLGQVRVTASVAPRTVAFLPNQLGAVLLDGRKTEVLLVDSVGANTAQNVARQVLGRVPGLVVSETEGSGFPSNGIAVRGLDPTQSVEMNVRQNGIGIAADPFGYPETYYVPPMEAVERVELIEGASGLQYGPQFGGVVNYIMRRGDPSHSLALDAEETVGSYGLHDSYASLDGGSNGWRWFGYAQRRSQDGWRPNSDLDQFSTYAALEAPLSSALTARVEYSALRNRIHMPGGLTDAEFAAGARQSFRARNWLTSPWNVASTTLDWHPAHSVRVESQTSYMSSARALVWRDEDGGPGALDAPDPITGQYVPREVEDEGFHNVTEELRLLAEHRLFGVTNTFSAGARYFEGTLRRQEGGEGSTGADFDLSLAPGTAYGTDVRYGTRNAAAWAEDMLRFGLRLTITPGVRLEHLRSTANGYTDTTFAPQRKARTIPLVGVGAGWLTTGTTNLYANVSEAYRPLDYSVLTPVASVSRIDPHMRDSHGTSVDLGWRGTAADDRIRFDLGVFHLAYEDRVGLRTLTDSAGRTYTERTNVANSVHQGLESYVEVTPVVDVGGLGSLSVFNSLALTDAHYTTDDVRGHRVEYAPRVVERVGTTCVRGRLSTTLLTSVVSSAFGDADNTERSADAVVGRVPGYTVMDWSASLRLTSRWELQAGINNLADRQYFTRRTDEYPGPGIIPAASPSGYAALRLLP